MDELRYLLEDINLNELNWVRFFRTHSAIFKQATMKEREDFIREYKDYLNFSFSYASQICEISVDFIRQNIENWVDNDMFYVVELDNPDEFIDNIQDWSRIFPFILNFDQKFLERWKEEIDWKDILEEKQFSNEFLNRNLSYFLWLSKQDKSLKIWKTLSYFQHLSDDFIEKYKDKLDWGLMSASQCFSENIMQKYIQKIDWEAVLENKDAIIPYSIERILKSNGLMS